jgi:hypothetical protein
MIHKATSEFWACFNALPQNVQELARKNFQLLKDNPQYPSLHFKKIGKTWSVRIGLNYRALAVYKEDVCYWHWIGTHAEYDAML